MPPGPFTTLCLRLWEALLDFEAKDRDLLGMHITGDTIFVNDLKKAPNHCTNVDITLLHQGGTRVLGLMAAMVDK